MIKLVQRKEHPILNHFISLVSDGTHQLPEKIDEQSGKQMSVEQLTDLRSISDGLYLFAGDLNTRIQRIEALIDINEEHEDKHL